MLLFSQGGAFSPPLRPARRRSYVERRYFEMVFKTLAINIPYCTRVSVPRWARAETYLAGEKDHAANTCSQSMFDGE